MQLRVENITVITENLSSYTRSISLDEIINVPGTTFIFGAYACAYALVNTNLHSSTQAPDQDHYNKENMNM